MTSKNHTISESYTLPSRGMIYEPAIDPNFTLRSMTTMEEMKRLSHTETPYKVMSEIIEDCLVSKPGIPVYDMYIGDYQYLLHRLRVVTYGPDYKMAVQCPVCGEITVTTINLDSIVVEEYEESFKELLMVHLPHSNKMVELKLQTPRSIEEAGQRVKELKKKFKDSAVDPSFLVTLQSLIKTVDGQVLDTLALENFIRKLPMKDANILLQASKKLNGKVGLDDVVVAPCGSCGYDVVTNFRFTSEFFGPSID